MLDLRLSVTCRQVPVKLMMEAIMPRMAEEAFSYERLETLGDAVLKHAVSLYLLQACPTAHEGMPMPVLQNLSQAWRWSTAAGGRCLSSCMLRLEAASRGLGPCCASVSSLDPLVHHGIIIVAHTSRASFSTSLCPCPDLLAH